MHRRRNLLFIFIFILSYFISITFAVPLLDDDADIFLDESGSGSGDTILCPTLPPHCPRFKLKEDTGMPCDECVLDEGDVCTSYEGLCGKGLLCLDTHKVDNLKAIFMMYDKFCTDPRKLVRKLVGLMQEAYKAGDMAVYKEYRRQARKIAFAMTSISR